MRLAIIAIAVFCALISGWTASLAQVHDIGRALPAHQAAPSTHEGHSATHPIDHATNGTSCAGKTGACGQHPTNAVHPMLCAACFAVSVETFGLMRERLPRAVPRPQTELPLQASIVKPHFPPPKTGHV